ncbi:4-hydroxy-3-methylbut-2-enyl diphosphate reductase [Asanoa sp. NPDC049573]|uniref:4-hydroxy-3-methylbut-2-enyl diphosphate reductase n=1 Tax=Asanoa sp. NPDC049573 TaxID=3155396 RepID=UPI003424CF86
MTSPRRQAPVICVALGVERRALRRAHTAVLRVGMGPRRAAKAFRASGALGGRPVLVAGVGGGLAPGVRPGDVVVATEVRGPDGSVRSCPSAPLLAAELRRLGLVVHLGPIASERRVAGRAARERLAATGALAVDTESIWLAPTESPFAVVRVVVDTPSEPLLRPGTAARGIRALRRLRLAVPAIDAWADATGPRAVRLANPRSFCAGVERAIEVVDRALERFGAPVYVRRQIVHNTHVVRDLERRGAVFVGEVDEVPPGSVLVFAAHGVSPAVRAEADARGLRVVDATCPLVTKVHTEVRRHSAREATVFLIGHADHEEVEGTVGEAPADVVVVEDAATAARVVPRDAGNVAYAMQTTLAVDEATEIADVLRARFPDLRAPGSDDICYATTNRQRAVRDIAAGCDLLLVVGSPNSSNSLRLVEVAQREGVPARLVDQPADLDLRTLVGVRHIGVTAGASAPPTLVDELVGCLGGLGPLTVDEPPADPEVLRFTLPKEVS